MKFLLHGERAIRVSRNDSRAATALRTLTARTLAVLTLCGPIAVGARGDWIDSSPPSVLVDAAASQRPDMPVAEDSGIVVSDDTSHGGTTLIGRDTSQEEPLIGYAVPCDACMTNLPDSDGTCYPPDRHDPPGLIQVLCAPHEKAGPCWAYRIDTLLLWRDAPRSRPIYTAFDPVAMIPGPLTLDADALNSDMLAAPRLSLLRTDQCGNGVEMTYIYAGNFYGQRALPPVRDGYATAAPGLYGNAWGAEGTALSSASAKLLGNLQSVEVNRRTAIWNGMSQFLTGFRWLQWNESLQMTDTFSAPPPPDPITDAGGDLYSTQCFNNLFGGQIGLDTRLLQVARLRIDGLVKAGAFYNAAAQRSAYTYVSDGEGGPFQFSSVHGNDSPAACAFVGEVGMTAVIPVHCNFDIRVGYFGLWLEGIAQPTNQLDTQSLTQSDPPSGTLDTTGGVFLQGLSLGLEGRW